MGHMYSVNGFATGVSTAGNIMEVKAAASKPLVVHSIEVGQADDEGDAEAQMLRLRLRRYTGVIGTGGNDMSVKPLIVSSPAGGMVGRVGPTVDGATVTDTVRDIQWNVQAGYLYVPTPEERIEIPAGAGLAVWTEAPIRSIGFSGTFILEEFV